jgi:hypothetical protein
MLINLVACLRQLRREEEALAVSRRAAALVPDDTTPRHLLWVALDAALRGDHEGAGAIVRETREQALNDHGKGLLAIVRAVLAVGTAAPEDRRRVVAEQHKRLQLGAYSASPITAALRNLLLFRARQRALRSMYAATDRPFLAWLHGWLPRSLAW